MVSQAGKLPLSAELQQLLGDVVHSGGLTTCSVYAKLENMLAMQRVPLDLPQAIEQTVSYNSCAWFQMTRLFRFSLTQI